MTPTTFTIVTAATHFVPAILWGTIAYDVWHYLRHRRPPGAFPRVLLALACLTTVRQATWTVIALLRGHLQTQSWLRGTLLATGDASMIAIVALARHVGVLWSRRPGMPEPGAAWLAVNYGVCAAAVVLAVLCDLVVLHVGGLSAYALFSTYMLVLGIAVVFDFRRGAARGTWRPGGLWHARTADVVVLAAAVALVTLHQAIPAAVGSTSLGLLLAPDPSALGLSMFVLNGLGAMLFAAPIVVRNLGDLLPAFLTALAATAAVLGADTAARTAAQGRTDPEIVALIDLVATAVVVFAIMPLRTWIHGIAGRLLFRRGRLRWAELHAVVHALPTEAGVVECCRRMLDEIVRVMKLRGAAILLRDGRTIASGVIDVAPLERGWPRDGVGISDHLLVAMHFRDLPPAVGEALTAADVLAVFPIASPRRRWGWVFVTTDLRGASFSDEDDAAIAAATDQAALTLDAADLLARTVEVERALAHAEKLAAIGELAARFAHDIRNPVTAARSLAQQLAREPTISPANAEHAGIILEELERVERQVRELLRFARRDELALAPTDVGALVRATARDFANRLGAAGVDLGLDVAEGVVARADAEKVRRVLVNLIENAMDALQNGRPEKHLVLAVARDGERAIVRVADDGAGIPADAQASVFDPFVSSKPSGTGLGLAIAKRIVDAHGGTITVASRPGATAFEIGLPLAREVAA